MFSWPRIGPAAELCEKFSTGGFPADRADKRRYARLNRRDRMRAACVDAFSRGVKTLAASAFSRCRTVSRASLARFVQRACATSFCRTVGLLCPDMGQFGRHAFVNRFAIFFVVL
jgi:hypothetical protein